MANTSVGEMAIHYQGRDYVLRPSFRAIQKIGDSADIVEFYNILRQGNITVYVLGISQHIVECCCQYDILKLTGYLTESPAGKLLSYCQGKILPADLVILATRLLFLGINGSPKRAGSSALPINEFDVSEYVGAAMAHLGLNQNDAWNLTMIEFQRACESKYPNNIPTEKEMESLFSVTDKVSEKLNASGRRKVNNHG